MFRKIRRLIVFLILFDVGVALIVLLFLGIVKLQLAYDERLESDGFPVPVITEENNAYEQMQKLYEEYETACIGPVHKPWLARDVFMNTIRNRKAVEGFSYNVDGLNHFESVFTRLEKLLDYEYCIRSAVFSKNQYPPGKLMAGFGEFLRNRALLAAIEGDEYKAAASLVTNYKLQRMVMRDPNPLGLIETYESERKALLVDFQIVCAVLPQDVKLEKFEPLLQPVLIDCRERLLYTDIAARYNQICASPLFDSDRFCFADRAVVFNAPERSKELDKFLAVFNYLIPAIPLFKRLLEYKSVVVMRNYAEDGSLTPPDPTARNFSFDKTSIDYQIGDFYYHLLRRIDKANNEELRARSLYVLALRTHQYHNTYKQFPEEMWEMSHLLGDIQCQDHETGREFELCLLNGVLVVFGPSSERDYVLRPEDLRPLLAARKYPKVLIEQGD